VNDHWLQVAREADRRGDKLVDLSAVLGEASPNLHNSRLPPPLPVARDSPRHVQYVVTHMHLLRR